MQDKYCELLKEIEIKLCPHLAFCLQNKHYATAFCQIEFNIEVVEKKLEKMKELKELLKGEL